MLASACTVSAAGAAGYTHVEHHRENGRVGRVPAAQLAQLGATARVEDPEYAALHDISVTQTEAAKQALSDAVAMRSPLRLMAMHCTGFVCAAIRITCRCKSVVATTQTVHMQTRLSASKMLMSPLVAEAGYAR